jgi:hypothetical protein
MRLVLASLTAALLSGALQAAAQETEIVVNAHAVRDSG